jgi:hypothetical protein
MQASMAIANRSAHATEEAAKAANLNAKAAIGVELPIVWIAKLELRRGPGIAGQIVGGDVPAEITPVLDFKNRGRTAAELRALSVQSEVTKARSKLSLSTSSNANFRLLPASIWKLTQHSQPEMEDSRSNRSPMKFCYRRGNRIPLGIWLSVLCRFFGRAASSRFCGRWVRYGSQPDGSLKPVGFIYDSRTPQRIATKHNTAQAAQRSPRIVHSFQ